MANILGAAAGWDGFITAMGKDDGSLLLSSMTQDSGFGLSDRVDLSTKLPAAITFNFSQTQSLFGSIEFLGSKLSRYDTGSYHFRGYVQKLICFYNSSGVLIASIGYMPYSYTANPNYPSGGTSGADLYIFFYTGDSITPAYSKKLFTNFPIPPGYGDQVAVRSKLQFYFDLTATDTQPVFTCYYRGAEMSAPASALAPVVRNIAKVTLGEFTSMSASSYHVRLPVVGIVLADTLLASAATSIVRPAAITANNQFTGSISDVNTVAQDNTFMSTSSEVSSIFEVDMASFNLAPTAVVHAVNLHVFARYVQAGGTSINLTCALVDTAGAVHASAVIAVTANEDITYARIKKVLTAITSAVNAGSFTAAQLNSMRVRITL